MTCHNFDHGQFGVAAPNSDLMGADDQQPDPVSTDPADDAAAEAEDLQTGGDGESANEPLIKKDPASEALVKGQAIVYDPDDGLDFESNMSKVCGD